jgi:Xaa-Pro aminopeptidase
MGGADAFLVTSLANVRYLTGFTGSNAVLLLEPDGALLGTDARYAVEAGDLGEDVRVMLDRQTLPAVVSEWGAGAGTCLAVEAQHLRLGDFRLIESLLDGCLMETIDVVESCRVVKDRDEISHLERACAISDASFQALMPWIRIGMTERDVARRLESDMLAHGADGISFPTIVAAGPHSAKPHHVPSDRPVKAGDLLLIDFGAEVAGYHADVTRTCVLGEPADWQRELHAIVALAQATARAAACAGADLAEVDGAARGVIVDTGYGERFGHGLGHGVGLEIHEAPFLGPRATGRLHAGSPVTIEPGIYLPERGGVRIEDTILVNEGPSRSLSESSRDLVVLG